MVWPVPSKHVFLASSNLVYSSNFHIFLEETRSTLSPSSFRKDKSQNITDYSDW